MARRSAAAVLCLLAAGCGDDRVSIAYRPPVGARATYAVEVRVESLSEIEGRAPERARHDARLRAHHLVLAPADGPGSRVQVDLRPVGAGPASSFVVVLGRAAQLSRVEAVEGHPVDALGVFGLAEVFPAAAAAPPGPLAPGDAWTIDEPVELPGMAPARLRGRGRLVELAVVGGRAGGVVETVTDLAVRRTRETPTGPVELRGVQTTLSRTTHALEGGEVERAESVTTGEFEVALLPPGGDRSLAVPGRISVTVRSTTSRVG